MLQVQYFNLRGPSSITNYRFIKMESLQHHHRCSFLDTRTSIKSLNEAQ